MPKHVIGFLHTIWEDGVWLHCSCGWGHNLKYDCSPEEAWQIAKDHRAGKGKKRPKKKENVPSMTARR